MTVVKPNKIVWMTLAACCGMDGDFELGDKQLHHMYASADQKVS